MYRLIFLTGAHKGRRLAVQQGDILLGSDPDCHVHLEGDGIPGRTATIERQLDGYLLRPLVSGPLPVINGETSHGHLMEHGDEIEIGTNRLMFQLITAEIATENRRSSKFQLFTLITVIAILVMQSVILITLLAPWRNQVNATAGGMGLDEASALTNTVSGLTADEGSPTNRLVVPEQ
jgi:hypothetical protein